MKRTIPLFTFLALTACDIEEFTGSGRYTEDFHYSFNLNPGGRLDLESFNGSIEISGWNQNKVEINGTKYAPTRSGLEQIRIEASGTAEVVRVRAVKPSASHWNGGVKFRIQVPNKTSLDRVATSNGPVRVEQVEGPGRFRTSNGPIKLSGYSGEADVTTSNGPVQLTEFRGSADVTTSNGSIRIDALDVPSSRALRLKTSNGPITVHLPPTAGARVNASTSNGSITAGFPLSSVVTQSKRRLEATIGPGGALLDLHTSNGPIRIARN